MDVLVSWSSCSVTQRLWTYMGLSETRVPPFHFFGYTMAHPIFRHPIHLVRHVQPRRSLQCSIVKCLRICTCPSWTRTLMWKMLAHTSIATKVSFLRKMIYKVLQIVGVVTHMTYVKLLQGKKHLEPRLVGFDSDHSFFGPLEVLC